MLSVPKPARINLPKQSRSHRTLERIVAASLELLATEGPDGLTVHRVVEKADSSVGSFYARFKGKDDLLDYLGERVWDEALERWNQAITSRDWSGFGLSEVTEGAAGLLIDAQRSRSTYLKALDRAGGAQGRAFEQFQSELLAGLGDLLMEKRDAIDHESPQQAVRLGLRAILGIVNAEMHEVEDRLPREVIVEECRSLLTGYLTRRGAGSGSGAVDFFDVWG